tara:strand:+ start:76 stop:492 length:417 start_codon:yes stop_codon:yes gene_type:complete
MTELKQMLEIRNNLISILNSYDNSILSRLRLDEIKEMEKNIEDIIIKSKYVLASKLETWNVLIDYAYELAADWFITEKSFEENTADEYDMEHFHPDVADRIHNYLRDVLIYIKCIRLNPNIVNEDIVYTAENIHNYLK